MARQTRAQRRARREQQEASGNNAGLQQRARTRQQQIRPAQPVKTQTGARRLPGTGGGGRRFVTESWGELRKVEWPSQSQVVQGTVVVLIACLIVGVFLYASDQVFKRLVENVFLR